MDLFQTYNLINETSDIWDCWHCWHCDSKFNNISELKNHLSDKHDIGVLQTDDDIDVTWFYCDHDGCNYKCKYNSDLKKHKRRRAHENILFQTNKKIKTEAS